MNKNIKKINDYLWLVNYDHIKAGYIKELQDLQITHYNPSVTNEGVLLVHYTGEENPAHDVMVKIYNMVMKLKNKTLKPNEAFKLFIHHEYPEIDMTGWTKQKFDAFIEKNQLNNVAFLFNQASALELKRRKIMKKHTRSKPFNKMKEFVGRK